MGENKIRRFSWLSHYFGNEVVAFRPILARLFGCPTTALFLSQAIYWQETVGYNQTWFKLRDAKRDKNGLMLPPGNAYDQSWEWELGLSRTQQESARRRLRNIGVLCEERRGVPAKLHFKICMETLEKYLIENLPLNDDRCTPSRKQNDAAAKRKHRQIDGEFLPSVAETTAQISKTTTNLLKSVELSLEDLIFPTGISMEQKRAMVTSLFTANLSFIDCQMLLDEVEENQLSGKLRCGVSPLFNRLLALALAGKYIPNLCFVVMDRRIREKEIAELNKQRNYMPPPMEESLEKLDQNSKDAISRAHAKWKSMK